jgi:cytochrome P450
MTYYPFHRQSVYPNPRAFNPDRFLLNGKLNADVPNPVIMTFGYSKRLALFRSRIFDPPDAH